MPKEPTGEEGGCHDVSGEGPDLQKVVVLLLHKQHRIKYVWHLGKRLGHLFMLSCPN